MLDVALCNTTQLISVELAECLLCESASIFEADSHSIDKAVSFSEPLHYMREPVSV